jgi:Pentapeptide repeats (9 copies)
MQFPHGRRPHESARPARRRRWAWLRVLAFRRQNHKELATVLSDPDATQWRITELYTKAVAQLVSDEPPVRFGGLYALERLAQESPIHRQIIVNVICAYLRMPFSPTEPASKPEPEVANGQKEPGTEGEAGADGIGGAWQQEKEVRLTAQRILTEHLRDDRTKDPQSTDTPSSRFWNNIRLDLTGATLIDFNLVDGVMADANFHRATFSGDAWFGGATFAGAAQFGRATFTGDASFGGATFAGAAQFGRATFSAAAQFGGATFAGAAQFGRATFSGDALFGRAVFRGAANFPEAAFRGNALFGEAAFSRVAGFHKAAFGGDAGFHKAAFGGDAGFRKAAFRDGAWFDQAAFGGDAWFDKATIGGDAGFGEATFSGVAGFDKATFTGGAWFGETTFTGGAWFGETTFTGGAWFGETTFTGDAGFDRATFSGGAWFDRATFSGHTWFGETTFSGGADALHFEQARILSPGASHAWPMGWRLADADGGGYTVVRTSPWPNNR